MSATFERPIILFVGLGFPKLLKNATDALQALEDLPSSYQDQAYDNARKACRAAIAGDVSPETARAHVVNYARSHELLADIRMMPVASPKKGSPLGA